MQLVDQPGPPRWRIRLQPFSPRASSHCARWQPKPRVFSTAQPARQTCRSISTIAGNRPTAPQSATPQPDGSWHLLALKRDANTRAPPGFFTGATGPLGEQTSLRHYIKESEVHVLVRIPPRCRAARVPGVHCDTPRIDSRHPGWLRVADVGREQGEADLLRATRCWSIRS
jgi:hypothetical protein